MTIKALITELRDISGRLSQIADEIDAETKPVGSTVTAQVDVSSASGGDSVWTVISAPPINTGTDVFGAAELITKLKSAKPGDKFTAKKGLYGSVNLSGINRGGRVTVACEAGSHFERLYISGGSRSLTFEDISAWPEKSTPFPNNAVIQSDSSCDGITIRRARVMGAVDGDDYINWALAYWQARKTRGIWLQGPNSLITECLTKALGIHLMLSAGGSVMSNNKLRGVSEDGMRIVGDGTDYLTLSNDVANLVKISTAHPDGSQPWSVLPGQGVGSGILENIRYQDNLFREWIGNPSHPLRAKMQGIGMHDGTYGAVLLVNNEIWTSAVPGIDVKKARVATVKGNRVYSIDRKNGDFARIQIAAQSFVSEDNIANRFTQAAGKGDTIANYVTAPQMSMVD